MSEATVYQSKDSYTDYFLNFIDETRNKDTEERFASYLNEYFNLDDDAQSEKDKNEEYEGFDK